ncbi:transcription factor IIF subunit tfg1 [Friedmanniomyces endolithicus]|nr:transcription factor IIF subunit tfg1 [Friedmanniomyces endolithicus]
MSTSPAKAPLGQPAAGNARAPQPRKKTATSIFNPKKKQIKKPLPANTDGASGQTIQSAVRPHPPPVTASKPPPSPPAEDDPSTYQEYPIVIEKSALMRGLHYHGFRMQSRVNDQGKLQHVDPYNESEFVRPVRLYRRRPQDKPELLEQAAAVPGENDKEREQREIKRAERQAEREANQALIAPTGDAGKKPQQKKKPQKKVEDVYYDESNPKFQARSQLRYEEARPWHLEDFDNNNRWVGSYEEPLAKKHVMFEVSSSGFNLVPIEKWYRMVRTDKVKALDDRQIEKMMDSKHKAPRWFRNDKEVETAARQAAISAKREEHAQGRRAKRETDDDDAPAYVKQEEYRADVDEIDFEYDDEFQDDDEGHIFADQDEDDAKDIEKKIREEMRGANLPDAGVKGADEQDWVNEEKEQRNAADDERRRQKKLKKQLKRKESRVEYESDSDDGHEYMESSESDSEEEREEQEEERKKEEAEKAAAASNGDKSGSSSKGNNTPSRRPEKKALKREAEVSDLSGNELSRKKARPNGSATGPNGARQLSPDAARRVPSGYGSGSDTDTSRAGRPKLTRPKNSPPGSPNADRTPQNGSRRGSPTGSRAHSPARPSAATALTFPGLEEVKAAIPKEGVAVGDLVKVFKTRLAGRTTEFIALVKQAGRQEPATKRIVPKD